MATHRSPASGADTAPWAILDAVEELCFVAAADGELVAWNMQVAERLGYEDESSGTLHLADIVAPEDREMLPTGENLPADPTRIDLVTDEGTRIAHDIEWSIHREGTTGERLRIGIGRTLEGQEEHGVERHRDEPTALATIPELILDITREILKTPSRRDIDRIVCERLSATDHYEFAWIGDRAMDGDRLAARVVAGRTEGCVESITADADDAETGRGPEGRAWRTGEVHVTRVDDEDAEGWGDAANTRGIEAAAAVPLRHSGTTYGVLGVYAASPDAFTHRAVEALRVLGEAMGYVTNAIKRRRLLFAEAVVDLSVALGDGSSVLARLATNLHCAVDLEGYLELRQHWVVYLVVEDATGDAIRDALEADDAVDGARILVDDSSQTRAEIEVTASPLLDAAESIGATVRETSASPEDASALLEVPDTADVRETVDLLTDTLPRASVRAKRERDRRPAGAGRPDTPLEDLTACQREALAVAFRAGYFDWPRGSTADEVARTLGISRATLHAHLRKAQRSVLSDLLAEAQ